MIASLRFYQSGRLATGIKGLVSETIFQADASLLAQCSLGMGNSGLLVIGHNRSVLNKQDFAATVDYCYTPYGYRAEGAEEMPLGFNGEVMDVITRTYILGNGHRAFSPVLMRFVGPDSLSPFGGGGRNAYSYCLADPVNHVDPSGRFLITLLKMVGFIFGALGVKQVVKAISPDRAGADRTRAISLTGGVVSAVHGFGNVFIERPEQVLVNATLAVIAERVANNFNNPPFDELINAFRVNRNIGRFRAWTYGVTEEEVANVAGPQDLSPSSMRLRRNQRM